MKGFLTKQVQNQKVKNLANKTVLYVSMLFLLIACNTAKVHKQNTLEEEAYELARTFLKDFAQSNKAKIIYFDNNIYDFYDLKHLKTSIITTNKAYKKGEIENIRPCEQVIYEEFPFKDAVPSIFFKEWNMVKLKSRGITFKPINIKVEQSLSIEIPYINKERNKAIFISVDTPNGGLLYYYEKINGKWAQQCSHYCFWI